MRVALITNFCPFYRVKLFDLLARSLPLTFIFFSDGSEKNWESLNPVGGEELPAIHLRAGGVSTLRMLWRLVRTLWRGGFDVYIQGLSGRLVVAVAYLVARWRGASYVLWTGLWDHPQTLFHRATFPCVRYLYRHADALVAYGSHVRDYLVRLGVAPERIFIAWNTADNERYNRPVSEGELMALRAELGLQDERVVLFVGRLSEEKGVDVLLRALARLADRTEVPPWRALICGRGPWGEVLRQQCREMKLENVRFLDYVPNERLYQYYALAEVLVVPSVTTRTFKEPWGLIVNEAMNQGCVVVASDAVGAARGGLLEDGRNGMVVPEGDAEALARALYELLCSPERRAQLSRAARVTIKDWTYERMAQGFIDAGRYVRKGA
ncbi:MAG: glycosyltransferase family 4 protein [bacterium]|nr:glycosyltransferase family 4 protein [bacterium]